MSSTKALETPLELMTVLASAEEEEILEKISDIYKQTRKERTVQEQDIKKTLWVLSKLLAAKENEAEASLNEKKSSDLDALRAEKDTTSEHISNLEANVRDLETNICEKDVEINQLQEKAAGIKNNNDTVLPQTKYNFSLYTNVTRIRWNYDSEDNQVKGFVASLKDVKPFCLNTSEISKYEIANFLWDLMDD